MSKESRSGGIGFLGGLTLIFIALKLAEVGGVAEWSWWWVLSPSWLPFAILLLVVVLIAIWSIISNILKGIGI